MKHIIIIHGWGGSSKNDWIDWARQEFENLGHKVTAPDMPNTETPVIKEWVNYLKSLVPSPDQNTYLIGHSIGCQTIIRFLETINKKIGGAIFVAGWFDLTNQEPEEKVIAKPWLETPISFAKIKNILPKSIAILSDNDPYVPYEMTKAKFETNLNSEIITLKNAGHMTSSDGFGTLPELIKVFGNKFQ